MSPSDLEEEGDEEEYLNGDLEEEYEDDDEKSLNLLSDTEPVNILVRRPKGRNNNNEDVAAHRKRCNNNNSRMAARDKLNKRGSAWVVMTMMTMIIMMRIPTNMKSQPKRLDNDCPTVQKDV